MKVETDAVLFVFWRWEEMCQRDNLKSNVSWLKQNNKG